MFGFVKNFLARLAAALAPSQDAPAPLPILPPPSAPDPGARPRYNGNGALGNGASIQLPLDAILNGLPLELHSRIRRDGVGGQALSIPLETILPQLARGMVRISFGALRRAVPHLFSSESDCDDVQVTLPLGEILSRLNPAFILRRRSQRHLEVPQEVTSPFDSQGRAEASSPGPPTPPSAESGVQSAEWGQAPAVPSGPSNPELHPDPLALVAPTAPRRPPGLLSSLAAPARPNSLIPMPSTSGPRAEPPPPPPGLISPLRLRRDLDVLPLPPPSAAAPQPPPPAQLAPPFILSLVSLAQGWPETVRRHILELNLVDANVALPAKTIEQALRQGRVAFRWKTLSSWITPAPPPAASAQEDTIVEVPLQIVAPLFLARQRQTSQSRLKVTIDPSIPNLFFGVPQPETPASAPERNLYVWDDASDTIRAPRTEAKHSPSPGTRFVAKYATPNEVVSCAAALDDVAGALIGLPDGLLVASRLGPDLNADTLAAFLPQIFGKVSQCTKELRMGELNNLNFTVGNIPWTLFRVNAIFFAAFGRPGQPLPASQLAALASELDHKPK